MCEQETAEKVHVGLLRHSLVLALVGPVMLVQDILSIETDKYLLFTICNSNVFFSSPPSLCYYFFKRRNDIFPFFEAIWMITFSGKLNFTVISNCGRALGDRVGCLFIRRSVFCSLVLQTSCQSVLSPDIDPIVVVDSFRDVWMNLCLGGGISSNHSK